MTTDPTASSKAGLAPARKITERFLYCRKYWMWPIWWKMDSRSSMVTSVHFFILGLKGRGQGAWGCPGRRNFPVQALLKGLGGRAGDQQGLVPLVLQAPHPSSGQALGFHTYFPQVASSPPPSPGCHPAETGRPVESRSRGGGQCQPQGTHLKSCPL